MRLLFLYSFITFSFVGAAQPDCLHLTHGLKGRLVKTTSAYMIDSLHVEAFQVGKPQLFINETYYTYVQVNRNNCDSLTYVPVFRVTVNSRQNNDYWVFDLDINGNIIWISQETEMVGDWEWKDYEYRRIES